MIENRLTSECKSVRNATEESFKRTPTQVVSGSKQSPHATVKKRNALEIVMG